MLKPKQVQSIAFAVAMLITGTAAAAVNVTVMPNDQELVSHQVDVLSHGQTVRVALYVRP
jgi:hypothetical protein